MTRTEKVRLGKLKVFIFLMSIIGLFFLTGCGDDENTAEVIAIEVKPQNIIIPKGATGEYSAIAYYSDGFELDVTKLVVWKSANPCIASIQTAELGGVLFHALVDPERIIEKLGLCNKGESDVAIVPNIFNGGFVQGIAVGETTIQVKYGDMLSHPVNIKVIDVPLMHVSVEMTPSSVIKDDSDSNESNESDNNGTVDLTQNIATTAVSDSVSKGIHAKYRVLGIFENLMQTDLTQFASFESSNTEVAAFDVNYSAAGVAVTGETGSSEITAEYNGALSAPIKLTVSNKEIESIKIQPENITLPKDMTEKCKAIAILSDKSSIDITDQVKWASEDPTVIQVMSYGSHAGYARALKEGNTTITASYNDINSSSISVSINGATLESIAVKPLSTTVANSISRQYSATGLYSDDSSYDLTAFASWGALQSSIARIDAMGNTPGLARTFSAGDTYIRAFFGEKSSKDVSISVTDAIITSIEVSPENITPLKDTAITYKALAHLSDGSSEDITSQVTWISSNPKVAKIDTLWEGAGDTMFLETGKAVITATFNDVTSNQAQVEVIKLERIIISPEDANISVDENLTFTAKGRYTNGSTKVLEDKELKWISGDNSIATISYEGIARGISTGTTFIEVTHKESNLSDSTEITITP